MTKKFGSSPHDAVLCAAFVEAGFEAGHIEAAVNLGLTFPQVISLVVQYGRMVISLCADLYSMYSGGTLTVAGIQRLIDTYGPQVADMIKQILAMAGIPVPV